MVRMCCAAAISVEARTWPISADSKRRPATAKVLSTAFEGIAGSVRIYLYFREDGSRIARIILGTWEIYLSA
jgi:hypothetical protein